MGLTKSLIWGADFLGRSLAVSDEDLKIFATREIHPHLQPGAPRALSLLSFRAFSDPGSTLGDLQFPWFDSITHCTKALAAVYKFADTPYNNDDYSLPNYATHRTYVISHH